MSNDTTAGNPDPSGRFVLRIDPGLHGALRTAARDASLSLNEYCARKLASPGAAPDPEASGLIERAARLLGESLVGVVAFGSWVRGESGAASDFDVLLIAEECLPITRELYGRWDREPALYWRGHEVEPHFVHLPPEGAVPSGTWAEVATDGLVLHERGWLVSERLADIRRMISAGRISRRLLHGQPYWVRAG
ncbi:MAG: toxin-antitoxin system HicB family antitoxin [Gemmatimonadota bacterium]|uniref:toxin-antitoxin system HicB family antitoxin n=1 Tax=Candidatus Palauibacter scopulicola TaxID=3056741 RepID=UPI0023A1115A|nr:toxin-antitoxin system HicB family antitoxin [Candidatus Palauibacter scopulicola]MDE2662406.1 toxin-antitoxin system HicB family antitoxin [Candidatus Palauibacter scopulicola]